MRRRIDALLPALTLTLIFGVSGARADEPRQNYFDDPFLQVTQGLAHCPLPPGPEITAAQMRAESHQRVERGNSCFQAGRCRLSNAYLYDKEIIPRVKKAIDAQASRFAPDTSVWAMGQRRWVWLRGCVSRPEQAKALEALVREIDDVEGVVNELRVLPSR